MPENLSVPRGMGAQSLRTALVHDLRVEMREQTTPVFRVPRRGDQEQWFAPCVDRRT